MTKKTDFRNIQVTQFDPGQIPKMTFSEINSAVRVTGVNSVLRDSYTHFVQVLDTDDRITKVTYYQATDPAIDQIATVADVSSSLASTYLVLHNYLTQKDYVFYFTVDSVGTIPPTGDFKTEVALVENDPASVVCIALKSAIDSIDGFATTKKGSLSTSLELEYTSFGETEAVDIKDTGFTVTRLQEGTSSEVGEIELSYDTDGNVVYNGSTLKGLAYNPFTASFDVNTVYTTPAGDSGSTPVELQSNGELTAIRCLLKDIVEELKTINIYNQIITGEAEVK